MQVYFASCYHCVIEYVSFVAKFSAGFRLKISLLELFWLLIQGCGQRSRNLRNNRRVWKTVAYYGLRNPPYQLVRLHFIDFFITFSTV